MRKDGGNRFKVFYGDGANLRDPRCAGGRYCARAIGHSIFTEAETWEEPRENVLEAVSVHFEDGLAHSHLGCTDARDPSVIELCGISTQKTNL
jgi:hypothetical protein